MTRVKVLVLVCFFILFPSITQASQIAIAPLQNNSEYPKAGDLASDMLAEELMKVQDLVVFDRVDFKSIIQEKRLQTSLIFDPDALSKVKYAGVDYLVTGSVIDCRTEIEYEDGIRATLYPFPPFMNIKEDVKISRYRVVVSVRLKLVNVNDAKVIWAKVKTKSKRGRDPLPLLRKMIKNLAKSLKKEL